MRNITMMVVGAFLSGQRRWSSSNSSVETVDGVTVMRLHGNAIAKRENGKLSITSAGWETSTTKERLNGIPGVSIYQKDWQWYLNGNAWDGRWTEIKGLI